MAEPPSIFQAYPMSDVAKFWRRLKTMRSSPIGGNFHQVHSVLLLDLYLRQKYNVRCETLDEPDKTIRDRPAPDYLLRFENVSWTLILEVTQIHSHPLAGKWTGFVQYIWGELCDYLQDKLSGEWLLMIPCPVVGERIPKKEVLVRVLADAILREADSMKLNDLRSLPYQFGLVRGPDEGASLIRVPVFAEPVKAYENTIDTADSLAQEVANRVAEAIRKFQSVEASARALLVPCHQEPELVSRAAKIVSQTQQAARSQIELLLLIPTQSAMLGGEVGLVWDDLTPPDPTPP